VAGFGGSANVRNGWVSDGHVHLGAMRVPGAGHLEEGSAASAYVRPHDVRLADPDATDSVRATVERVTSLGWLTRLTLRLPDDQVLVAHIPQDEVHGAKPGDAVAVDLRRPKTFSRVDAGAATAADHAPTP
jgi:sulfate/thiosulfate transport system ATP-binding protein